MPHVEFFYIQFPKLDALKACFAATYYKLVHRGQLLNMGWKSVYFNEINILDNNNREASFSSLFHLSLCYLIKSTLKLFLQQFKTWSVTSEGTTLLKTQQPP